MKNKLIILIVIMGLITTACSNEVKEEVITPIDETEKVEDLVEEGAEKLSALEIAENNIVNQAKKFEKMDLLTKLRIIQTDVKEGEMTEDDAVGIIIGFRGDVHVPNENSVERPMTINSFLDEILQLLGYVPTDGPNGIGDRGDYSVYNTLELAKEIGLIGDIDIDKDSNITYQQAYDIAYKGLFTDTYAGGKYIVELAKNTERIMANLFEVQLDETEVGNIKDNIIETRTEEKILDLIGEVLDYVVIHQEGEVYKVKFKELLGIEYYKTYEMLQVRYLVDVEYKGSKYTAEVNTPLELNENNIRPYDFNLIAQNIALNILEINENEVRDYSIDNTSSMNIAIRDKGSKAIIREYRIKYNFDSNISEILKQE